MGLSPNTYTLLTGLAVLVLLAQPIHAFGAGNIASVAKIEGSNWRHGDIEDTLLNLLMSRAAGGKKFSKMDVKRVYFGNWLRDYSQAVDVGTVKMVSAEAIRILLWVLGFLSFGYGTGEFEVTMDRLGCYRPEEHIDNPKDYADNLDARQYDRRLRGPVDERRELSIDPQTGLKNYIASERLGIATSAGLVRNLFGRSIQLGRQYGRSKNKKDLYEALRLLGTGCHCLEDYSAHSNYTELALVELGERDIFPHVGRQTAINVPGARHPVYPIVTGTFGGVDFLHSVCGEFSDKVTQSEISELEGTIQNAQSSDQGNTSVLQGLLNQLPDGLLGGGDKAGQAHQLEQSSQAAQMSNLHVSPKQPEAWTRQLQEVSKQIYPILEWHDGIMQSINETIEKIPVLPDLIEQVQDQINVFVFSLLAPFVLPVINQVKSELSTGSTEIIQSSKEKQEIVFHDDRSTDPTHSMLSKDHFSNVLNEPAGKVASQVLKWVVPQLIQCWDDERVDVDRTLNRIIAGVFHHPALASYGDDGAVDGRRQMFGVVEQWWSQKAEQERRELRDQLSRDGVLQGRNHKEGVHDSGHGCGKPLGMPTNKTASSSGAIGGIPTGDVLSGLSQALGGVSGGSGGGYQGGSSSYGGSGSLGKMAGDAGQALGGGALGGLVGGLVGGVGASLFGGSGSKDDDDDERKKTEKKKYKAERYDGNDGSYTTSHVDTTHQKKKHHDHDYDGEDRYKQSQHSQTAYPSGGSREEYKEYEQYGSGGSGGYGVSEYQQTRPAYGGGVGGYEATSRHESVGGGYEAETRQQWSTTGSTHVETRYERRGSDSDDHKKKHHEKEKKKKHHKKHGSRGSRSGSDSDDERRGGGGGYGGSTGYGQSSGGGYGQSTSSYGGGQSYGGSGRDTYGGGAQSYGQSGQSGYGGSQSYGGQSYGQGHSGHSGHSAQSYGQSGRDTYGGGQSYGGGDSYGGGQSYGQSGRGEYGGGQTYSQSGRDEYGNESYGQSRRDEYGGQSGYGQGGSGGYGSGGNYGGSSGGGYGGGGYDNNNDGRGYGGGGSGGYGY